MTTMSSDAPIPFRPAARVRGLALLAALVGAGIGASSLLYRQVAANLADNAAAARGELPRTPEGRLDRWIEHVEPGMASFLQQYRLSEERPWIVTHAVGADRRGAELEIWGFDFTSLPKHFVRREGLDVVVEVPAARLLGTGELSGDRLSNVPCIAPGVAFDVEARERQVVEWALQRFVTGLTRDIEGAKLVVRIGSTSPAASPSDG
jgi:hypothetical protein